MIEPRPALAVLDPGFRSSKQTSADALQDSISLARIAESLGYYRYWLTEHHGFRSYAIASPEVVAGFLLATTSTMRIGPAGLLLPNHRTLRLLEVCETLHGLAPQRVDIAVGFADGSCSHDIALAVSVEAAEVLDREQRLEHFLTSIDESIRRNVWLLTSGGRSLSVGLRHHLNMAYAHFVNPHEWDSTLIADAPRRALAIAVAVDQLESVALHRAHKWASWRSQLERCGSLIDAPPTNIEGGILSDVVYGSPTSVAATLLRLTAGVSDLVVLPIGEELHERVTTLQFVRRIFSE